MEVAAALLLWLLMGVIGFAVYKARRTPMLATVPGVVWRRSFLVVSLAAMAIMVAVVASSERRDWSLAAMSIGVYLVVCALVWLAIQAARRRSE